MRFMKPHVSKLKNSQENEAFRQSSDNKVEQAKKTNLHTSFTCVSANIFLLFLPKMHWHMVITDSRFSIKLLLNSELNLASNVHQGITNNVSRWAVSSWHKSLPASYCFPTPPYLSFYRLTDCSLYSFLYKWASCVCSRSIIMQYLTLSMKLGKGKVQKS